MKHNTTTEANAHKSTQAVTTSATTNQVRGGKVIALYRVSTDKQDLTRQQIDLRRALTLDRYNAEDIIEIGNKESGVLLSMAEREGIATLKQHVENGGINAVYVHELSRLSRRTADTFAIRDYLKSKHVQLICLNPFIKCFTDSFEIDPTANLVFSIMASMAENEGYIRKERFRSGKARNKAQGKYNGGRVLFGYQVNAEGKFEIDPNKADIVRRIFDTYCNTDTSARQIANQLYKEGLIKQTDPKSREAFVLKVLKSEHYKGDSTYPQIVSNTDKVAIESKLSTYQKKPRQTKPNNVYYAHGLLKTADHNRTLMPRYTDYAYNEPLSGYSIQINMIDSLMMHFANDYYTDPHLQDPTQQIKALESKRTALEATINTATRQKAEAVQAIDKTEERLIKNRISEEKAEEIERGLELDIKQAEKTIKEATDKLMEIDRAVEELQNRGMIDIYKAEETECKELIRKAVEYVSIKRIGNGVYVLHPALRFTDEGNGVGSPWYIVNPKQHRVWAAIPINGNPYYKQVESFIYLKRFNRTGNPQGVETITATDTELHAATPEVFGKGVELSGLFD